MARAELRELEEVCAEVRRLGYLSFSHLARLFRAFGQRLAGALEALRERRVKRYLFRPSGRTIWVVVGKRAEYLILPRAPYCSCDDFFFRVIDGEAKLCYHIIAQRLAECLNWFEELEVPDEEYAALVEELRNLAARPSHLGPGAG
ncbi:hypothetical protein DRO60_04115 [Candidatus Bathyarchaeota archaeon]|nr:MAG: hypothetical protein DRO60_04115 [Candidatus Bathyarchaeota archaeon]